MLQDLKPSQVGESRRYLEDGLVQLRTEFGRRIIADFWKSAMILSCLWSAEHLEKPSTHPSAEGIVRVGRIQSVMAARAGFPTLNQSGGGQSPKVSG